MDNKMKQKRSLKFIAMVLIMTLLPFHGLLNVNAQVIAQKIFTGENSTYEIIVEETSVFSDGYVAQVTIKNIGSSTIRNWNITANMDGTIKNVWNAEIIKQKDNKISFAYQAYNRNISPGKQVVFGMQIENGSFDSVTDFLLLQEKQAISDAGNVSYEIKNCWEKSAIIEATIYNTGDSIARDWKVAFTLNGMIDNLWNGEIIKREDNQYVIGNKEYNADIAVGESVSFGFQVSYNDDNTGTLPAGSMVYLVSDAKKEECPDKEKIDWYKTLINADEDTVVAARNHVQDVVKVALLDSGVDDTETIDVDERVDFIGEAEEETPLWDDLSGHGTGVAGLIVSDLDETKEDLEMEEESQETADDVDFSYITNNDLVEEEEEIEEEEESENVSGDAIDEDDEDDEGYIDESSYLEEEIDSETETKDGETEEDDPLFYQINDAYGEIEGLNKNVSLVSLRVLDENNEAPVNRVIDAIQWAIDNKVNIIHTSWGTATDNKELHEIIKKAYNKGILIIAPAGNEGEVLYPAKYEEVIAVGSVDHQGNIAHNSASGEALEIVAPGENITVYTSFGMLARQSGTSFAAPQVTALAAILWQQDITKSNRFIRQLIAQSATPLGAFDSYGYGLVNYKKAIENYDAFSKVFQENNTKEQNAVELLLEEKSSNAVEQVSIVGDNYVKGLWEKHDEIVKKGEKPLKQGLTWPDKTSSQLKGKREHPAFHGSSDYVGAYLHMMSKAKHYWNTGKWSWDNSYMDKKMKESYEKLYIGKSGDIGRDKNKLKDAVKLSKNSENKKIRKAAALHTMGMALHTLGDTFAHKSYGLIEKTATYKDAPLKDIPTKYSSIIHGPKIEEVDTAYVDEILGEKQWKGNDREEKIPYFDNRADCKGIATKRYKYTQDLYTKIIKNKVNKSLKDEKCAKPQDFICAKVTPVTGGLSVSSRKNNLKDHFGIKGLKKKLKKHGLNVDSGTYQSKLQALDLNEIVKTFDEWKLIKIEIPIGIDVKNISAYKVVDDRTNQVKKTVIHPEIVKRTDKAVTYGFIGDVGAKYIISVKGESNHEEVYATVKTKQIKKNSMDTLAKKSKKRYVTVTNVKSEKKYNTKEINTKCNQISLFQSSTVRIKEEKFHDKIICGGIVKEIVSVKNNKVDKTAALKDATVTLSYYGNDITYQKKVKTDDKGRYLFEDGKKLIPGIYNITVEKSGYQTVKGRIIIYSTDRKKNNKEILMVKSNSKKGGASGQITDAKTGKPVGVVELIVRVGIGNYTGDIVAQTMVNEDGTYQLSGLPAGSYTVELVDKRDGKEEKKYVTGSMDMIIVGEEVIANQNGVVSNQLYNDQIRIVLTWGEQPKDLDSHLIGTTEDGRREHMFFAYQQIKNNNGIVEFMLDVDDTDSFGPETTTIYHPSDDNYHYYVHNYSRGDARELMNSGAMVQVYKGDDNLPWQTFYVPQEEGFYWDVFSYDAEKEILTPYDEVIVENPE